MSDPLDVSVVWACMICRETGSDSAHDLFAQFLENGGYRLLDKQLNLYFKCDHCGDLHCAKCLIGLRMITLNDAATASGYRCESCRPKGVVIFSRGQKRPRID